MKKEEVNIERRKFVGKLGLLSAVATFGAGLFFKKKNSAKTVKMLSQDGKLVEVDVAYLGNRKKVTDNDIQTWIKKN